MNQNQWKQKSGSFFIAPQILGLLLATGFAWGEGLIAEPLDHGKGDDLSALSLEQLTNMEVSSVARRDQQLYKSPAAVFVITQEDIRRSGASNIPELLRIVPGVQVAQVEADKWAVSIRGFNGIFADKMLVMIDGRSVYTPIYSGVFWDQNSVLIEDIERIEVIRGPGATMWGANAVNGVLNVITKKAATTLGTQVVVSEGSSERQASIRYGAQSSTGIQYRFFLTDQRILPNVTVLDGSAHDGANFLRGGARLDWQAGVRDWITLHGDMYRGRVDQRIFGSSGSTQTPESAVFQDKSQKSGGYALIRWEHSSDGADFALQAYYYNESDKEFEGYGREGTTDIDFQNHLRAGERNDVTWGLGYRYYSDHIRGAYVPFAHDTHQIAQASSFIQNEFSVIPNKLVLTAGSKFQWNSYTHFEIQPGVRLLWTPGARHSVWASFSRSVRTPSVRDRDLLAYFPVASEQPLPMDVLLEGSTSVKSEVARAHEGGYRRQIRKQLSIDLAGFFYRYSKLVGNRSEEPYLNALPSPVLIAPVVYGNYVKANSQGVEASVTWNPLHSIHVASSYAWLQAQFAQSAGVGGAISQDLTWSTPRNSVNVRGSWEFERRWTLDGFLSCISETPTYNSASPLQSQRVPAYRRLDLGVAHSLGDSFSFRLGANNLQAGHHLEFNPQDNYNVPSQVSRSVFAKVVWSF